MGSWEGHGPYVSDKREEEMVTEGDPIEVVERDDVEEILHEPTMRERWDRIIAALTNPFHVSPKSPDGASGLADYIPACRDFFVGFAKSDPEQAGMCFFYTIAAIKIIILIHILAWIF